MRHKSGFRRLYICIAAGEDDQIDAVTQEARLHRPVTLLCAEFSVIKSEVLDTQFVSELQGWGVRSARDQEDHIGGHRRPSACLDERGERASLPGSKDRDPSRLGLFWVNS